jgi:hypothetical protein
MQRNTQLPVNGQTGGRGARALAHARSHAPWVCARTLQGWGPRQTACGARRVRLVRRRIRIVRGEGRGVST